MIVNVCESGLETEGLNDWDLPTVSEREREFETCSVIDLVKVFVRSCVPVKDELLVQVIEDVFV